MEPGTYSHQTPSERLSAAEHLYSLLADNYQGQTSHAQTLDAASKRRDEGLQTAESERQRAIQNAASHRDAAITTHEERLETRTTAANEAFTIVQGAAMETDWPAVVGFIGEPPSPRALNKPSEDTLQTLSARAEDIQQRMRRVRADLLDLHKRRARRRQYLVVGIANLILLMVVVGGIIFTNLQSRSNANATATQESLTTATQVAYLNATATQAPLSTATAIAYLKATATRASLNTATQASLSTAMITYQNAVLSGNTIIRNFDGVPMVLVPLGCFMMGSDPAKDVHAQSDEEPQTKICFGQSFWLDETPVTQAQFRQFGGKAGHSSAFSGDNRPVESITWFEARDFCAKRGARLPTEAEYEYAARGPDDLIYPWGNGFDANKVVYTDNSAGQTVDVGSKPLGKSWVGALDMSGNVWEWTSSLYKLYPYDPNDGRENTGDVTSGRVLRGGWWDGVNINARAAFCNDFFPSVELNGNGFRCVHSL